MYLYTNTVLHTHSKFVSKNVQKKKEKRNKKKRREEKRREEIFEIKYRQTDKDRFHTRRNCIKISDFIMTSGKKINAHDNFLILMFYCYCYCYCCCCFCFCCCCCYCCCYSHTYEYKGNELFLANTKCNKKIWLSFRWLKTYSTRVPPSKRVQEIL